MTDSFGPCEDCLNCGHAISRVDYRFCPTCNATLCINCSENHECTKCAICKHEIDKSVDKYLEDYAEWVCGDECHIKFLEAVIEEDKKYDNLAILAKKAATTGNLTDLRAYLKERRIAI